MRLGSAFVIAVASLFIPSARFAVNAAFTCVRYLSALLTLQDSSLREPSSSIGEFYKSLLKRPCHTLQITSIVAALGGETSRDEPV